MILTTSGNIRELERLALSLLWWGAPVFGDECTHHIQPSPFSLMVL